MGRHLWHYEMLRNQVIKAAILEQGTGISHQLDYKCSLFTTYRSASMNVLMVEGRHMLLLTGWYWVIVC